MKKTEAPSSCPSCNRGYCWNCVGEVKDKSGVNVKNAIIGGIIAGGVGAVLGGFDGKKRFYIIVQTVGCK